MNSTRLRASARKLNSIDVQSIYVRHHEYPFTDIIPVNPNCQE